MKKYILLIIALVVVLHSTKATNFYATGPGVWETSQIWETLDPVETGKNWAWVLTNLQDGDSIFLSGEIEILLTQLKIYPEIVLIITEDGILTIGGMLSLENTGSKIIIKDGGVLQADTSPATTPNNDKIWIGGVKVWWTALGAFEGPLEITPGGITPVTLSSFTAKKQKEDILLNWTTLTEINFDYFSIERSYDGKNFTTIGTVKGSGWSQTKMDYEFVDQNPLPGINYYRLKSVDFDGYTEYFPPISVFNDNTSILITSPAKDKRITVYSNIHAKAQLVNLYGASILTEDISNGANELFLPGWLPQGVYVLLVSSGNQMVKKEKVFVE